MLTQRQFERMLHDMARHSQQAGMSDRVGYVHEVMKDKIRVVIGIRPDGSPWLSPWLHTTNMRGGARERRLFEKGQNVRISAPGGDYRHATVTHYAESESFPAPDHADDHPSGETYQIGNLFVTKNRKPKQQGGGQQGGGQQGSGGDTFYDIFIADAKDPPAHKDQDGKPVSKEYSAQQREQQKKQKPEPKMKLRVSEDGYITGRVGTNMRFAAHKQGVKIRAGGNVIFVDDAGCWTTKPIRIKPDSIPNDDK